MRIVSLVVALSIAVCALVISLLSRRDRWPSLVVLIVVTFSAAYLWPQVSEGVASPCEAAAMAQVGVTSSLLGPTISHDIRRGALAAQMQEAHPYIPVALQYVVKYYRLRYQ